MGGKRLKFPSRGKYVPKEKQLGKYVENKKEKPKEEDINELVNLWGSMKKKTETTETSK
ncbi:MAG: hypothetical protein V1663_00735 [archaeon]